MIKDHKIKQLDKDISNKIAAGEVVERPLAVVKELVENAIDAGATKIIVEIKDAGKTLIRITDNGFGIPPDDVQLAFERHSTSKIRTINDIYHISSLGFRGEALASIASVSIIEVITKHKDYDMGKKLILESGKIVDNHEIGAPQGTTILVKDLFYNTPARLKFLKSNHAEQTAINDIMNKLALSHPEVSFKYIVGGHNIFMSPGNGKLYDVILNVFEKQLARNLIALNFVENDVKLEGFISTIEMTRGNRQHQVVFVNNRYVKSKIIEEAISLAYRTLIPHNRFPIVFINLEIDPSLVDINIHPAKTEIRFHQEGLIKDIVYKSIAQELNRYNLVPNKPLNSKPVDNREVLSIYRDMNNKPNEELKVNQEVPIVQDVKQQPHFEDEKKVINKSINRHHDVSNFREKQIEDKEKIAIYNESLEKITPSKSFSKPLVRESIFVEEVYEPAKPIFEFEEETIYDGLNYIGQIFNTYLLFEKKSEMYLMDQHAAHEKILYEQYVADFKKKNIMSQMILEPLTIPVNYMEMASIINESELLQNLGFNVESFGEDTIIVREIPSVFDIKTAKLLITELIENINFKLPKEHIELSIDKLMQASCKAAIKANDRLEYIEVKSLLQQLKGLEYPYTCPHGRPIIISISKQELEKKFNRT